MKSLSQPGMEGSANRETGHDRPAIPFLLSKGFFSIDPAAVFSYTPSIYLKREKMMGS